MSLMSDIFTKVVNNHRQIASILGGILSLREPARVVVKKYLQKEIKQSLMKNLTLAIVNVGLVIILILMSSFFGDILFLKLLTSLVCIVLIILNCYFLLSITLPELIKAIRLIKSKRGYALKYLLGLTIGDLLIDFKIVTLALLIILAVGTKWGMLGGFSILSPWQELF